MVVDLFIGKIKIFNFLNPLNVLSKLSDTAKHFRCMSRFSLPFFTGITVVAFYLLDRGFNCFKNRKWVWLPIGLMLILCVIDVFQMAKFASNDFKAQNYFSDEGMRDVPLIEESFDAILPIPYYHVGSEKLGYIIDDTDQWSRFTYQLAIKNKKPLVSNKMSRTPVVYAQKQLSLFQSETDSALLSQLKGKRILICQSKVFKAPEMKDEPAKSIAADPNLLIDKWQPKLIKTTDGVEYYLLEI